MKHPVFDVVSIKPATPPFQKKSFNMTGLNRIKYISTNCVRLAFNSLTSYTPNTKISIIIVREEKNVQKEN